MKNSARYGVTTGALVLAGICLSHITTGAGEFAILVMFAPVLFGGAAGFVAHSGEGS
jgi:hypothetical protein